MPLRKEPGDYPIMQVQVLQGDSVINGAGGNVAVPTAVPTTAAGAYASGDVIGTKMTFTSAVIAAGGSGLIQAAMINSKTAQTTAVDLILFNADPSNSTFTDNAALSVNAADFDKVIGVAHITDWTSLGTPSLAQANNLAMPYTLAGTSLYGVLVARAAITLGSASDFSTALRVIRN